MMSTASGDEVDFLYCYLCRASLDLVHDYTCVSCGRAVCDRHLDVCQGEGEDCELIACYLCVESHRRACPYEKMEQLASG